MKNIKAGLRRLIPVTVALYLIVFITKITHVALPEWLYQTLFFAFGISTLVVLILSVMLLRAVLAAKEDKAA